ncbi:glycosyltransferase family 92 protein F13G3.3-like [Mytilus edulis]|uniref:Glycosyltransferase family 92 protein n=1 Tax=Mytilus edulis TaxID=6550 RepID=A0A8S3VI40_MYTED|nr:unnamed protein product [Mytilus edulis]
MGTCSLPNKPVCGVYRIMLPLTKVRRISKQLLKCVILSSVIGLIIPLVIFWRGEYVHVLKYQWVPGETCQDIPVVRTDNTIEKREISVKMTIQHGWQAVDNENLFYLFSSFYVVDRDSRYVLLIGAMDKRTYDDLQCAVTDNKTIKYVPARYMAMWDDQLLCTQINPYYTVIWDDQILCRYSPTFFTCVLPNNFYPTSVTLSRKFCQLPSQMLPVIYPTEIIKKFTICVAPLHGPYDNVNELIEMIELNKILGADHFTFYNFNISSRVNRILDHYIKQGMVDIVPWNMPINLTRIHYYGQMAALNDCLYRNRHKSRYIVVQDMDEFIIPKKHRTWHEMMLDLPSGLNVYSFQSVQFSVDIQDIETNFKGKESVKKFNLVTLLKQKHGPVYDRTTRTKYIVEASRIKELGIHNVWQLRDGSTGNEYHVPPEDALMFHYRHWFNEKEIFTGKHNPRMMMYKDNLLTNIQKTFEKLKLI